MRLSPASPAAPVLSGEAPSPAPALSPRGSSTAPPNAFGLAIRSELAKSSPKNGEADPLSLARAAFKAQAHKAKEAQEARKVLDLQEPEALWAQAPPHSDALAVLVLAQASADAPQPSPETPSSLPTAMPPPAASSVGGAASRPLLPQLQAPLSEFTTWSGASFFGAAPAGAVLSGAMMTVLALNSASKDKSNNDTDADADTQAPTLLSADISNSTGTQLVLRYNENLSTVLPAANAFQVLIDGVSTPVSTVARGSDQTSVVLTLSTPVTSARQVSVSLRDGGEVKDLDNNIANSFRNQAVTVTDLVAPTLLATRAFNHPDPSQNSAFIVLRFSEALLSSTVLDSASFQVRVGGVLQSITALEVLGDSVRLALGGSITGSNPLISLSYAPPSDTGQALQDSANNLAAVIGPLGGIAVSLSLDTTAPALLNDLTAVAATERQVRELRLRFTEELDASQLPPTDAFSVIVRSSGNTSSVAVSRLKLVGSELSLTLADTVTDALAGLQVVYTPPSTGSQLKDWAGNPAAAFERNVALVDTTAPLLVASRFTNDRTLELTFNEDLASLGPAATAFSMTANGGTLLTPVSSVVSGKTLSLGFASAVQSGQTANLVYSAPADDASPLNRALQDSLGNDSPGFTHSLDTSGPSLVSAQTSENGLRVLLNYNELLLQPNPNGTPVIPAVGANAFVVLKSDGSRIAVNTVTIVNAQVQLDLARAILPDDTVSIIYNAPAANVGVNNAALQDSSGNDAASLGSGVTGQAVTNNTQLDIRQVLLNSTTRPFDEVVIQFNEPITASLPANSAFTVQAGTVTQSIVGMSRDPLDPSKLRLSLSESINDAGALQLSYVKPSSNPITANSGKTLGTLPSGNFGELITSTPDADNLTGAAARRDYFLGSAGNDTLTGAGGADLFVWPDFAAAGPGGFTQTLTDFGFKKGNGALQGSAETDVLDLRLLLDGYTQSNEAQFFRAIKNANNKLVLQIDHNGGTLFEPTANLLFDNLTFTTNDQLQVNGQFIAHTVNAITSNLTLTNFVEHLRIEGQLTVL